MKGIKIACRVVMFAVLFCLLLLQVQNLVTPNWDWPDFWGRTNKSVNGFLNEGKNTLDVLWLGTSHTQCGISPMYIYEQSGIRSYNLATSSQPLLLSYHRLKSAFRRQSPKVVFLDASACYYSSVSNDAETRWLKTINSLPMSSLVEKAETALDMPVSSGKTDEFSKTVSAVFPIMRFHSNYMADEKAYLDLHLDQPYPQKGIAITTKIKAIASRDTDIDEFFDSEEEEEELTESEAKERMIIETKFNGNQDNLNRILDLCRANNCALVMMKMPVVSSTTGASAAWSPEKHQVMKDWCDKQNVEFLDLNYVDLDLDWQLESCDGGKHLNLRGAEKVSRYLSDWLMERYTFEDSADRKTLDAWNSQLEIFNIERKNYNLQMVMDMAEYLDSLKSGNYTVLSAVCAPAEENRDAGLIESFRELTGTDDALEMIWQEQPDTAYVSVSSNGVLIDRQMDTDSAEVTGTLPDGTWFKVQGKSAKNERTGSIVIGDTEMAVKGQGACFVVYDNDMGSVVDSVLFKTQLEGCPSKHGFNYESSFRVKLIDYENRLLTGKAS